MTEEGNRSLRHTRLRRTGVAGRSAATSWAGRGSSPIATRWRASARDPVHGGHELGNLGRAAPAVLRRARPPQSRGGRLRPARGVT